jgi:hypothetical protein
VRRNSRRWIEMRKSTRGRALSSCSQADAERLMNLPRQVIDSDRKTDGPLLVAANEREFHHRSTMLLTEHAPIGARLFCLYG